MVKNHVCNFKKILHFTVLIHYITLKNPVFITVEHFIYCFIPYFRVRSAVGVRQSQRHSVWGQCVETKNNAVRTSHQRSKFNFFIWFCWQFFSNMNSGCSLVFFFLHFTPFYTFYLVRTQITFNKDDPNATYTQCIDAI